MFSRLVGATQCYVDWRRRKQIKCTVLLDDLGYLPLAITQAGAFLNENAIAVGGHLGTFHIDDLELQDH